MTTHEIRQKFIDFYAKRGHVAVPSASLVPENDPTTLFTGSGMQPMLQYFLDAPHPLGKRIVNSQRAFRSQDIEEIGDNRHTTFFEMLGNWSFGDYFKQEQIPWMFEFLVTELGLDPNCLYFTCFRGDETLGISKDTLSAELWQELFEEKGIKADIQDFPERDGMQEGARIFYYDSKKNWWSRVGVPEHMPAGEPGGPDTEMFFDFGADLKIHEGSAWSKEPCHVNCDCGRFVEIGNNVFMQYLKTDNGFELLPAPNVDFGGGLERLAMAINDEVDIFKIDLFDSMRTWLEKMTGRTYGQDSGTTHAFRLIMDHMRAATFLIADGVHPGNKDQGYVVRRLIRRAIHAGHTLGLEQDFCAILSQAVIDTYEAVYPELLKKRGEIIKSLQDEEEKFKKTLKLGLAEFARMTLDKKILIGEETFLLLQSYGFPFEMTQELALEKGVTVSQEEFDREMTKHQDLSRSASAGVFKGGLSDHSEETTRLHTATHLLLASLRSVLNSDAIEQKGSNITAERLRFDFNYPEKMTPEQITAVEALVNLQIDRNLPVIKREMSYEEALAAGAIGIFEGKPGQKVSVYEVVGFSLELCGGPHVTRTGELGHFKIVKEESSSSGVRRIKATLG